jgi:putative transposase
MKYDPSKHHRRSIRLKGYDYSQAGAYFVTICINQGLHTLGEIRNSQMYPSQPGEMVQTVWDELPLHYPGVAVDAFVLMPNHVHGIIVLQAGTPCLPNNTVGATTGGLPLLPGDRSHKPMSLGDVIHRFKSLTTAKYRHGVIQLGWTPFPKRFWQRNYHENIIRDEQSWDTIRGYILNNPIGWESEPLHLKKYHPQPDV